MKYKYCLYGSKKNCENYPSYTLGIFSTWIGAFIALMRRRKDFKNLTIERF